MKQLVMTISFLALGLTIIPSMMVLSGKMDIETNKNLMTVGMILWFAMAPLWINRRKAKSE